MTTNLSTYCAVVDLEMVRGDSATINFVHGYSDEDLIVEARLYVRARPEPAGTLILSVKMSDYPLQWTLADSGNGAVALLPANTAAAAAGVHYYDIEITDTAGVVLTVQRGRLTLIADCANDLAPISPTDYYDATVTDQLLKEWTTAESYEMTAITYHGTYLSVPSTATVKWPDGSAGTFTATTVSAPGRVDAYTITHTVTGKTVTQAAVTRNAGGGVTVKPALTVTTP